jgi:threonine/homoserine efflux transporter RhtA
LGKLKIKDISLTGITFGVINGLIYNLYVLISLLFRVNTRTPWGDASTLFFSPPEVYRLPAQIFGFLMSLNAPIFIGIALCLLVRLTGKDFIYVKALPYPNLQHFLRLPWFIPHWT